MKYFLPLRASPFELEHCPIFRSHVVRLSRKYNHNLKLMAKHIIEWHLKYPFGLTINLKVILNCNYLEFAVY